MSTNMMIQGTSNINYCSIRQILGGTEGTGERFHFTVNNNSVDIMEGGVLGQLGERYEKEQSLGEAVNHHINRGDYLNHLAKELSRVPGAEKIKENVEELRDEYADNPDLRDRLFNDYLGSLASDLENLSSTSYEAKDYGTFKGQTTLFPDESNPYYPKRVVRITNNMMDPLIERLKVKNLSLEQKLDVMEEISTQKMLANYLETGAMVASPSTQLPNYYFCWRRDAGLTTKTVVDQYGKTGSTRLSGIIDNYIEFTKKIQDTGIIADAKYNIYGYATYLPWGNPQNDGPGFNAATFVDYAEILLSRGKKEKVVNTIYPVIKKDLDYLVTPEGMKSNSFDVWEEVNSDHLFSDVAKIIGLRRGAELAGKLGYGEDVDKYKKEAARLNWNLSKYLAEDGSLKCHINEQNFDRNKKSKLDAAVIGALLYANDMKSPVISLADPSVMKTVAKIENAFSTLYPINQKWAGEGKSGIGIGRYPEDVYDGVGTSAGNPWYICTSWFARYYYQLAQSYLKDGMIDVQESQLSFLKSLLGDKGNTLQPGIYDRKSLCYNEIVNALIKKGDGYVEWIMAHIPADGSISEQINKDTGKPQGAKDLGWSYVEMLNTVDERKETKQSLKDHLNVMRGQRKISDFIAA